MRAEYLEMLNQEMSNELFELRNEIEELRRAVDSKDNELRELRGVEKVLIDCQSESTAFLRGVEAGFRQATERVVSNLPEAARQKIMTNLGVGTVDLEPETIKLEVDSLEAEGNLHDCVVKIAGQPLAGMKLLLRLDYKSARLEATEFLEAVVERLTRRNQELETRVSQLEDQLTDGTGRPI